MQYFYFLTNAHAVVSEQDRPPDPTLDVNALIEILKDTFSDWERLGIELGIKYSKIKEIDKRHRGDPCLCMADLLQHWLESDLEEASWEKMAITLDQIDKRDIAKKIREMPQHQLVGPPKNDSDSYIPPST